MPGKPTPHKKPTKGRLLPALLIAMILLFSVVPWVNAHGIHVIAWVEGNRVFTESYFSNKNKVIEGDIKVFGPTGKLLLEGKTDVNGIFTFQIPRETELKIVLESAMGHRAEYFLKADEAFANSLNKDRKAKDPGLYEIVSGIGIILGLAVLILFFRTKKRKTVLKKGR